MTLGIVGATGWLGQGLGLNLLDRVGWPPGELVLLNRSGPGAAYAGHPDLRWAGDIGELLDLCDTVVLSVRPEDFPMPGFAPQGQLLISFMAGWTMAALHGVAPGARIVRAMPNGGAPAARSYTPWLGEVSGTDAAMVERILSAMGAVERIATEDQLDVLTAISGSGPAYPALLARALIAAGRASGLPPAVAERAAHAVVTGAGGAMQGGAAEADDLIAALKEYRGVTAAGLDAAEAAGFETAVQAAITAAVAKARSFGR